MAGPQLVVPATVPRYALNAANARWGSLFDAFYGTDALPQDHDLAPGYDEQRGAQVIAAADELLDELFPLAEGSHADVTEYRVEDGALVPALADPGQFAGSAENVILLRRHGLHVELKSRSRTPGRKILDHDVGAFQQFTQYGLPVVALQVQGDGTCCGCRRGSTWPADRPRGPRTADPSRGYRPRCPGSPP